MSRQAQRSSGGLIEKLPVKAGAIAGAFAYVGGYLVTVVFSLMDTSFNHTFAGRLFYNAHFVDSEFSQGGRTETYNLLSEGLEFTVPELFWYLVPVALLLYAGYALTNRQYRIDSQGHAAAIGATVVAGYLPLVLLGTFLFEEEGASPETGTAIILAGLFFPLVLGGIGGYVATTR